MELILAKGHRCLSFFMVAHTAAGMCRLTAAVTVWTREGRNSISFVCLLLGSVNINSAAHFGETRIHQGPRSNTKGEKHESMMEEMAEEREQGS